MSVKIQQNRFFLLLSLLAAAIFFSCHGVDSKDTSSAIARSNVNTFRSLRLGQTVDPNSPVATTAGANNGEAIVILNRAPGSTSVEHVLYLSSQSDVARISFADGNLPSSAQAEGASLNFSNYTSTSVDVQIVAESGAQAVVTIPFDDVTGKLVNQVASVSRLARAVEPDSILRSLYQKAIIGVRLFGCGSQSAIAAQGVALPEAFIRTAQAACSSLLVDLLRAFIAQPGFEAQNIPGLSEEPKCQFTVPGWTDDFSSAEQCALSIGGQLIDAILKVAPDIQTAVQGTPTPTPTPAPTPKPSNNNDDDDDHDSSPRCNLGRFRCADGGRTCNENACDGTNDCGDGSDESSDLCTPEVLCCINSNGCPGEAGGTCSAQCCCCGSNQRCSRSPFLDGCVRDSDRVLPEGWFEGNFGTDLMSGGR